MENSKENISIIQHPKHHMYHIFNHKELSLCMVCKYIVSNGNESIFDHFQSKIHEENIKSLFKMCFPNSLSNTFDSRHLNIIMNSVFDLSLQPGCEKSYVIHCGKSLFCMICQTNVSKDECPWACNLVNHLKSDYHKSNIQNNVYWVYPNRNLDLVMFYKTTIYCSICGKTITCTESSLLQSIIDHSQAGQHKVVQNEDSELRLCEQLQSFTFSDNDSLFFEGDVASDVTCINEDSQNSTDIECPTNGETCEECGETVDIYNEDLEFSINLHRQKHKNLEHIEDQIKTVFQEGSDYLCSVCQREISIYNRDIELSLNIHKQQCKSDSTSTTNAMNDVSPIFLNNLFDILPKQFEKYRNFFSIVENNALCKLCNCVVYVNRDLNVTYQALEDHLENAYHTDQYNSLINTESIPEDDDVIVMLAKKHPIVSNNINYIDRRGSHYVCTLCNKQITYTPDENNLISNFVSHLAGRFHKKTLTNFKHSNKEKLGNNVPPDNNFEILVKDISIVRNNKQYIVRKGINYQCTVCNKGITYSPDKNVLTLNFKSHLEGKFHRDSLKNTSFSNIVSPVDNILELLIKKLPVVRNNIYYIERNGKDYICTLCNKTMQYHPDENILSLNFISHLKGSIHRDSLRYLKHGAVEQYNNEQLLNNGSTSVDSNIFEMLVKKLSILKNNRHYVEWNDYNYLCTLCNKPINYAKDENKLLSHFKCHFEGKIHTKALRNLK